jgi:hypothetical protein
VLREIIALVDQALGLADERLWQQLIAGRFGCLVTCQHRVGVRVLPSLEAN